MKLSLIVVFITLLLLFSCKKEIFKSEFSGTVRHFYTRLPISGIPIKLSHGSGGWLYGHQGSDGTVATDGMGAFSFKLRREKNSAYSVAPDHLTSLDSTLNEWKYIFEGEYLDINESSKSNFLLKPSGIINLYINDSIWNIFNIDTLIVESIYLNDSIIKNKNHYVRFYVEPSKFNKFIWYGLKNGIKVYYEEKNIFVPNENIKKIQDSGIHMEYSYQIFISKK